MYHAELLEELSVSAGVRFSVRRSREVGNRWTVVASHKLYLSDDLIEPTGLALARIACGLRNLAVDVGGAQ